MKKYKTFIGIDPDCEKSGVAVVEPESETPLFKATAYRFHDLIKWLFDISCRDESFVGNTLVVIEGGWLNRSNWHLKSYQGISASKAAAMGRNVGMNHQTGILIAQMCEAFELDYKVVKPLPKSWHGKDGKITAEELEYFVGRIGRCNQDVRDAVLLAWTYAGLPVKVKTIGGAHGKR